MAATLKLTPVLVAKMSCGGKGQRGALNYDAQKPGSQLLWTSLEGSTPRQWARQMGAFRKLNPRCGRVIDHVSLSLDPRLGKLTDAQWIMAAQAWLKDMRYGDRAVVVHRHVDEPHDHLHLVISRIDSRGAVHADGANFRRAHAAAIVAAEALGLKPLSPRPDSARLPASTDSQVAANRRAKSRGTKVQNHPSLARIFEYVVSKSTDLEELERGSLEAGLELQIVRKSGGSIQGLNVKFTGADEWSKASQLKTGSKTDRSLSWSNVETRLARAEADRANAAARESTAARVVARLQKQPQPEEVLHRARALLPAAATQEAHAMARHLRDPNDKLGFLAEPPPPLPPGRIDDAALLVAPPDTGKREALERIDRERAAAQAEAEQEIQSELKTKSKKQLELLRSALKRELSIDQAEAIEQMLARFLRIVLRLVSLGSFELPVTDSERRGIVARRGIELVNAEIQRRADVEVPHAVVSQAPRVPRAQPAPEKFQIVRVHDPRRPPLDRDAVGREQDAERERNRK